LVIPAAHWAETTTVPAVGEVLRRDRQEAMDEPWQTLIGLLGQTLLAEASNHVKTRAGGRSENISHKRQSHVAPLHGRNCPMLERLKNAGWIAAFVALCAVWGYEAMNASQRSRSNNYTGIWICPILGNAALQERQGLADGKSPLMAPLALN
jgi:hypothetical protein